MPINPNHIPTKREGRATKLEGPWRVRAKQPIRLFTYGAKFIEGVAENVDGLSLRRICGALGPRIAFAVLLDENGKDRGVLDGDGFRVVSGSQSADSASDDGEPADAENVDESADSDDDEGSAEFVEIPRAELRAMSKDALDEFGEKNGVKLDRRKRHETMVDDLLKSGKVRATD